MVRTVNLPPAKQTLSALFPIRDNRQMQFGISAFNILHLFSGIVWSTSRANKLVRVNISAKRFAVR